MLPKDCHYSDVIKVKRNKTYSFLSTELPKAKLSPIPMQMLKEFESGYRTIFQIYDMKTPFKQELEKIDPRAKFFASYMGGSYAHHRIRKLAALEVNNNQYVVFQQTTDFSNVLTVLDVKNEKRYRVKNLIQVQALLKILLAPLEELPLLMNENILKNKKLKKMLYKLKKMLYARLGCTY